MSSDHMCDAYDDMITAAVELFNAAEENVSHMLGVDSGSPGSRNYAAVDPGSDVFKALERAGIVECYREPGTVYPYRFYRVTRKGAELVGQVKAFNAWEVSRGVSRQ